MSKNECEMLRLFGIKDNVDFRSETLKEMKEKQEAEAL